MVYDFLTKTNPIVVFFVGYGFGSMVVNLIKAVS